MASTERALLGQWLRAGPGRSPRRWQLLLGVVAAHAVSLWLLAVPNQHTPSAAPVARMTVVLLASPLPSAERSGRTPATVPKVAALPADERATARPGPRPITPPWFVQPADRAPDAGDKAPNTSVARERDAERDSADANANADAKANTPAAIGGSTTTEAPAAPLQLGLPPASHRPGVPSIAQQAVERQVGGTPRSSAEARMSQRFDTQWTEENLGDGRVRLRRGGDCVILKETVAARLDPWNNRGPTPRGASACP